MHQKHVVGWSSEADDVARENVNKSICKKMSWSSGICEMRGLLWDVVNNICYVAREIVVDM